MQWNDLEKAAEITGLINHPEMRGRAHIAIAKHFAKIGDIERCKTELNRARPLAVNSPLRDELVDAFLSLAESPELAISFVTKSGDDSKSREGLCEALARYGYLEEALATAGKENGVDKESVINLKIALAAAKAARVSATEQAVEHVEMGKADQYYKSGVWAELAEALYKDGDLDSARKYAARVTDKYVVRRKQHILGRIAEGVPPNASYINRRSSESAFAQSLKGDDPDAANRLLEATIAEAERNPIETTSGQFGPWNQKGHLAQIRLQYAPVAVMYHKSGNHDEAAKKMGLARAALQTLSEENGFAAMVGFAGVFNAQIAMDDIESLKRSIRTTTTRVWLKSSELIVGKILAGGDVEGAKEVAKRAVAHESGFGRSGEADQNAIIACFIEAGEMETAHELVASSRPSRLTALACEDVGRAMFEMDRGQLLQSEEWQTETEAFQRAFLSIGAAIAAREQLSDN